MPAVDDRLPGVKETVLILVYRLDVASAAILLQGFLAHFEGYTSPFDAVNAHRVTLWYCFSHSCYLFGGSVK